MAFTHFNAYRRTNQEQTIVAEQRRTQRPSGDGPRGGGRPTTGGKPKTGGKPASAKPAAGGNRDKSA